MLSERIDISIIVVACNVKELIEECFTAIKNSDDHLIKELIYVDNGSSDGTVDFIRQNFPETAIIESPINLGFIRANNLAYQKANGKYVLMLNSDAFVGKATLQQCHNFLESHQKCGVVGCRLIDRKGNMQPSARYFPTPWKFFIEKLGLTNNGISWLRGVDDLERDHQKIFECDWVVGCFLLVRKEIIDDLGFFLREDYFMYYDDCDLCLRVKRKGWSVFYYPDDVVHLGGANSAKLTEVTSKGRMVEKYNLESEFIYFRKNYNLLMVVADFILISIVACIRISKKFLTFQNAEVIRQSYHHAKLALKILVQTKAGKKSIH